MPHDADSPGKQEARHRIRSPWLRFTLFFVFCFLMLGLVPLLSSVLGDGSLNFDAAAAGASQETGLKWTSNLLTFVVLCSREPLLWLVILGSAAPSLAALANLFLATPKAAWHKAARRLNPIPHGLPLRYVLRQWLLMVVLIVPALILTYALRLFTGGDYPLGDAVLGWQLLPALFIAAFLDQGAVLEEFGWRGYATNDLQDAGVKPLRVALLVGVCWGLWHVPRDVTTGVIERLGTLPYLTQYLPSFVLGTVVASIIASYFMNKLGGSLLPAIMVHGLTNDSVGFSGVADITTALTPYHQFTRALPLGIVALLLIVIAGPTLGRSQGGRDPS